MAKEKIRAFVKTYLKPSEVKIPLGFFIFFLLFAVGIAIFVRGFWQIYFILISIMFMLLFGAGVIAEMIGIHREIKGKKKIEIRRIIKTYWRFYRIPMGFFLVAIIAIVLTLNVSENNYGKIFLLVGEIAMAITVLAVVIYSIITLEKQQQKEEASEPEEGEEFLKANKLSQEEYETYLKQAQANDRDHVI